MPKKYDYSPVIFQIALSTYKLDFQNKNYIYKIKTQFFFYKIVPLTKQKPHRMHEARVMRLVYTTI